MYQQTLTPLLILMMLAPTAGSAGDAAGDWRAITGLEPATRIEVIQQSQRRVSGAFVSASETALIIRGANDQEEMIAKSDVMRISTQTFSRKRRALVGMAIGAGAAAVGMAIGAHTGDIDIRRSIVVGSAAVVGGGIGAAVGAASGGPRTLYRRP